MLHSHLNYGNLVWGHKKGNSSEKGIKIKELQPGNFHTSPLILGLNFFKTLTRSWQNNSKKLRIDK